MTDRPRPSILRAQHDLLTALGPTAKERRAWTPDELITALGADPATQADRRYRYNMAAYRARATNTGDRDQAFRDLRISVAIGGIGGAWMDPSLEPLRKSPAFEQVLAWADLPRLTDLSPLRPIGEALRKNGIFTAFQLVSQARSAADRAALAPIVNVNAKDLEAAARFADLVTLLEGETHILDHLWTVNVRSVCDLAHADIAALANGISIDQFDWEPPLRALLEHYQARAKQRGPLVEPHLGSCPGPKPAAPAAPSAAADPAAADPATSAGDDDRDAADPATSTGDDDPATATGDDDHDAKDDATDDQHCCSCTSHACRGEHAEHVDTESHASKTCWIHPSPAATQAPSPPAQPDAPSPVGGAARCDHPRTIDGTPPAAPDKKEPEKPAVKAEEAPHHDCACAGEHHRSHRRHHRRHGHRQLTVR